jgi:hypothetical protein
MLAVIRLCFPPQLSEPWMIADDRTIIPRFEEKPRFDKVAVAGLTQDVISEMAPDELIEAIQIITLPSGRSLDLRMKDRTTLERLVYLARRTCRNQGY